MTNGLVFSPTSGNLMQFPKQAFLLPGQILLTGIRGPIAMLSHLAHQFRLGLRGEIDFAIAAGKK